MVRKLTEEDLFPGMRLNVGGQGTCLTPLEEKVTVLGIHGPDVRYRIDRKGSISMTPIERFLDIVNGGRGSW